MRGQRQIDCQPINNANEFRNRKEKHKKNHDALCLSFVMNTFDEKLICRYLGGNFCVNLQMINIKQRKLNHLPTEAVARRSMRTFHGTKRMLGAP
jgi:hypothetical protein